MNAQKFSGKRGISVGINIYVSMSVCVCVLYYIVKADVRNVTFSKPVPKLIFSSRIYVLYSVWCFNLSKPTDYVMCHQFNIQQFYVLPTQCIYVFCVDLRTNSDYFTVQH